MPTPRDRVARKYYRVAKQRLVEAITILHAADLPAAAQYLGGYAVECMLKALVLTMTPAAERGSDEQVRERMKRLGHDLDALRGELARRGARMSPQTRGEFLFLLTWDPQSRYEPGPGDPHEAERFLSAATRILQWADERM